MKMKKKKEEKRKPETGLRCLIKGGYYIQPFIIRCQYIGLSI